MNQSVSWGLLLSLLCCSLFGRWVDGVDVRTGWKKKESGKGLLSITREPVPNARWRVPAACVYARLYQRLYEIYTFSFSHMKIRRLGMSLYECIYLFLLFGRWKDSIILNGASGGREEAREREREHPSLAQSFPHASLAALVRLLRNSWDYYNNREGIENFVVSNLPPFFRI